MTSIYNNERAIRELKKQDLARLTNEMIDHMLVSIANCADADVTFVPEDPNADDTFADDADAVALAWTLGHVIVHTTASSEESAFLAAELARGVKLDARRSRYEEPWETVRTIAQCRERLEESRRMRLSMLDAWPDVPHWDNAYELRPGMIFNCVSRFVLGLKHDDSHAAQIENIVRQAANARTPVVVPA